MTLNKLVGNLLIEAGTKIKSDTCVLTEEDALDIVDTIANISKSKEECAEMLNVSRATFDNYVRDGLIPKPHKRRGITNVMWFRKDMIKLQFSKLFKRG